ncbi:SARP family transcriptional regulator [Rhizocola hellebori]|uniref:SARP family transcriptional regulator n=1 Tax=Rhizocola hellebori TaxID=1392758 RepID=A0A8J3VE74_9ACTN|nr:SARP family transcriptional regulator [Rhizocola hellebori]
MAGKAGIDPKTVRSLEAGRGSPRPATVRRLAEALGLEGQERERFCASAVRPAEAVAPTVPAQLARDIAGFAGRRRELDRLDRLLDGAENPAGGVIVLSGSAGVGKTALALHWAHRVADRFPDGQLCINLRGFDPSARAMTPDEALPILLDGLGVPAESAPASLDAQIGRYRSQLAGRRMLIVLDDARDAKQVRPLLPGTASVLVVITSRNQLSALVARDGAHPLGLQLLSPAEAGELVAQRLGGDRVSAEPEAVEAIVAACARLPLALVIAAARAQQTGFSLTAIAEELRDSGRRLDALDSGDRSGGIRSVFSWSYTALSPSAARLFRLLALHPGADIATPAAASLAGHPPTQTRRLLTELADANLVTEHAPDRYAIHDLLRDYATELAGHRDPEPDRRAATARLLLHYLHTAHRADRLLNPQREPSRLPLDPPAPDVIVEHLADGEKAMRWFTAEEPNLVAAQRYAADAGLDSHTWQLAWSIDTYLIRRGHRHTLAGTWQAALSAARRLRDQAAQAQAHRALAIAQLAVKQYQKARQHAEKALDLFAAIDDPIGEAHARRNLAYLLWRQGNPEEALRQAQRGLALFRAADHRPGVANELNGVGWYHAELGQYGQALHCCRQALLLLEELGDRVGIAYTLDSLGYVHHHLGQHAQAIDCYQRAIALQRQLGDRHDLADTQARLGDTHHAIGDDQAAHDAWQEALTVYGELQLAEARSVEEKIHALNLKPSPIPGAVR